MPDRRLVLANADFKKSFNDLEQTCQDPGGGEVLLDFLLAETKAFLLEFFAQVRNVPGVEFTIKSALSLGKITQVLHVLLCKRARPRRQVTQESNDFFR